MSIVVNNKFKIILVISLLVGLLFLKELIGRSESSVNESYPRVELSHYGSLEADSIQNTFQRAVDDLNGKKLVIPAQKISLGKLDIIVNDLALYIPCITISLTTTAM